jgi:AraC-like DNA-binding protein
VCHSKAEAVSCIQSDGWDGPRLDQTGTRTPELRTTDEIAMDAIAMQEALFAQLAEPFTGELLFDCLTDLVFFLKNSRGEYVVVNQTLANRCGVADKRVLLGRTAREVFPEPLGVQYEHQDREVLRSGRPILNRLEIHLYPTGQSGWCLTTKLPLRGRGREIAGLAGFSQDLRAPDPGRGDYQAISQAVDQLGSGEESPPTVRALARSVKLTEYQFDQRVRRLFGLSAKQFVLKVRMDRALWLLRDSDEPIARIALDCNYSEQSAFTRQFKRAVGISPAQYRRAWRGVQPMPHPVDSQGRNNVP